MNKKKHGFSLLELMLVIAVMGVIILTGLSYIREKALDTKIDKTALQIQQWLQAGVAYYNDNNGSWPITMDLLLPNPKDPNQPYYILESSRQSPWGTDYTFDNKQQATDNLFSIHLQLPISQGIQGKDLAQRIIAKLPSARWDIATNILIADIGKPTGPGGGSEDVIFKGIYKRTLGGDGQSKFIDCNLAVNNHAYTTDIPKPLCPPSDPKAVDHYEPRIFVSLQEVNFPVKEVTGGEQGVNLRYLQAVAEDNPNDPKVWRAYVLAHGLNAQQEYDKCRYAGTITAITTCVKADYDPNEPR